MLEDLTQQAYDLGEILRRLGLDLIGFYRSDSKIKLLLWFTKKALLSLAELF